MIPATLPLIWKAKHYPPLYTLSYKTGDKIRVTFLLIIMLNLITLSDYSISSNPKSTNATISKLSTLYNPDF